MRINHFILILVFVALASGSVSFFVTRHNRCSQEVSCGPGVSCKADIKGFQSDTLKLTQMLTDENSSRDQILNQAQKAFRVRQENLLNAASSVLKTKEGRQKILDLVPCSINSTQTNTSQTGQCCVGPDCCCKFDSVQSQKLIQSDPEFLKASNELQSQIETKRQSLVSLLNDNSVSDAKILAAIESYMEKNNALELRSIEYFVSIRSHLTPEQRKQIFCWCTRPLSNQSSSMQMMHEKLD